MEDLQIIEVSLEVSLAFQDRNVLIPQVLVHLDGTSSLVQKLHTDLSIPVALHSPVHFLILSLSHNSRVQRLEIIGREYHKRPIFELFAASPRKASKLGIDPQEEALYAPLNEEEEHRSLGEYVGAHVILFRVVNVLQQSLSELPGAVFFQQSEIAVQVMLHTLESPTDSYFTKVGSLFREELTPRWDH